MNIFFVSLLLLIPSCILGVLLYRYFVKRKVNIFLLHTIALVCITPSLLFASYYLHIFDSPWYYEFRSWRGIDYLASLSGLSISIYFQLLTPRFGFQRYDFYRKQSSQKVYFRLLTGVFAYLFCVLFLSFIFAKPFLILTDTSSLYNEWKDGICIQTSPISCGPCSAASILSDYGETVTENILAQKSFTSRTGTLNCYLARAIRSYGYEVSFDNPKSINEVQTPAIIGVKLGRIGHFLVLFGKDNQNREKWIIGDPLIGKLELTSQDFKKRYEFDSFAMIVNKH